MVCFSDQKHTLDTEGSSVGNVTQILVEMITFFHTVHH